MEQLQFPKCCFSSNDKGRHLKWVKGSMEYYSSLCVPDAQICHQVALKQQSNVKNKKRRNYKLQSSLSTVDICMYI